MTYRIRMTRLLQEGGVKLAPEIKRLARQSLKELAENPYLGKPLEKELSDFHSYAFLRYRIVYKIQAEEKAIDVVAVAHRSTVYTDLAEALAGMGNGGDMAL